MNKLALFLTVMIGLAACAAHPRPCRDRLTPINRLPAATVRHP